jgi:hypothetical protein
MLFTDRNFWKKLCVCFTGIWNLILNILFLFTLPLWHTYIDNHSTDTRQRNNLYLPQENSTFYKKGAYYSRIKVFNNSPLEIENVAGNQKKFKTALKQFLFTDCFHTLEEYLNQSVLYHKISYYIGPSFEVLSMYII